MNNNIKMIHLIVLGLGLVSITYEFEIVPTDSCDNANKVEIVAHEDFLTFLQSTNSDNFDCIALTDVSFPWPVDYTITLRMRSKHGSSPGIIFNYQDDGNYYWIYFLTGEYACVQAGQVIGNINEDFSNLPCNGNYLSDDQWYDVVVNVSSTTFEVSVNNWMVLSYSIGLSLAPSIGFTHRYGYEYWCKPDYQCSYDFGQPELLARPSDLYPQTGSLKNTLQLPDNGTSTSLQQNLVSVMRIYIDRAEQPVGSYCVISFFFKDYDIGVGELFIQGNLVHELRAVETYSTNSPFIDVVFNSKTIDANRTGFAIEYEVLRCGVVDKDNIDMSYFCEDGNHINLYEDFYRSTANDENGVFSDSSLPVGWYQFSSCAGTTIPTTMPGQENICGTQYPIWMKDEAYGTVCVYKSGDACSEEWKIPVYDCPGFKLYYLTPSLENSGYCAGHKRKCNISQSEFSLDGLGCEPCVVGIVPEIDMVVIADDWITYSSGHKLPCTIHGSSDPNALYFVEWLVDFGTHRETIIQSNDFEPYKMMELEFSRITTEYLQHNLVCRAQSRYDGVNSTSNWHESQPYFIGMKIQGPQSQVSFKTDKIEAGITFTLPLSENPSNCEVDILFAMSLEGLQKQTACSNLLFLQPDLVHLDTCSHKVNCSNWKVRTIHKMRIKNTLQRNKPIYSKHEHTLYAVVKGDDNSIWSNIVVETQIAVDITGQTDQIQTSSCSSQNDPHLYPFNSSSKYDFHDEGEYVLYKSTPLEDKDMLTLVTVLYKKCHYNQQYGVACNKGVGIRVNNEAVFIDRTRDRGDELQYIRHGNTQENGFLVTLDQPKTKYEIFLPRGEKVEVTLSGSGDNRYLNVRVNSRLETQADKPLLNGLCGEIRRGPSELRFSDLIFRNETRCSQTKYPNPDPILGYILSDFGASWKVNDSEKIIGQCSLPPHVPRGTTEMFSCKVDHWHDIVDLPTTQLFISRFVKPSWNVERCIKTSDGSTDLMEQLRQKPLPCTKEKRHTAKNRKQTRSFHGYAKRQVQGPWTDETAYTYCNEQIVDSSTGQACSELTQSTEVSSSVDQCASDILVSGSTSWTDGTLASLRAACLDILYDNLDLWTFEPNSTDFSPPPTLAAKLCPNDCSARGECIGGKCECNVGFIGTDCSLSTRTPPTLDEILDGYICQYDELCDTLKIAGDDFVAGYALTCHFLVIEETPGAVGNSSSSLEHTAPGYLLSNDAVLCPWPHLVSEGGFTKLSVGVSNDGVHVSDHLSGIAVSHSPCLTCEADEDGDVVCFVWDGFCMIENQCIGAMNSSSLNECMYCDPESANYTWTHSLSPECSKEPSQKGLALAIWEIALIAVGGVIVLAVVCIIIVVSVKKCSSMQKVSADPRKYIRPDTPANAVDSKRPVTPVTSVDSQEHTTSSNAVDFQRPVTPVTSVDSQGHATSSNAVDFQRPVTPVTSVDFERHTTPTDTG